MRIGLSVPVPSSPMLSRRLKAGVGSVMASETVVAVEADVAEVIVDSDEEESFVLVESPVGNGTRPLESSWSWGLRARRFRNCLLSAKAFAAPPGEGIGGTILLLAMLVLFVGVVEAEDAGRVKPSPNESNLLTNAASARRSSSSLIRACKITTG